ncbi:MAG: dienelactone hydrolase family protein [Phycisphaerae bacterium]|nr:dienelactone hydrolase family protein [Phycisphaerae bacterium]
MLTHWSGVVAITLASVVNAQVSPVVGRDVLAAWYLEADRAWTSSQSAAAPTPDAVERANREFDSATTAFFRLAFGEAIGTLRQMSARLTFPDLPPPGPIDQPMVMEAAPRLWVKGEAPPRLSLVSIRPYAGQEAAKVSVQLIASLDQPGIVAGANAPVNVEAHPAEMISADLSTGLKELAGVIGTRPGRWTLTLADTRGVPLAYETLWTVESSLAAIRVANAPRLAALAGKVKPASLEAAASRNRLLTDTPGRSNSAEFLADFGTLPADVNREISELEAGRDPYPLDGTWWFTLGGEPVAEGQKRLSPIACWASATPAKPGVKRPLIIALHGAGGDESMFFRGYGAGALSRLSSEDGLVIASPATGALMASGSNFTRLVSALGDWYDTDPDRIYVIGHSMGAGAASSLAQRHAGQIAAVVCFAGGQVGKEKAICPMLFIAGEIDPLIPASRLRPMALAAAGAGLPVEFREKTGNGHTFIVGDHLPEAFEWLLVHRRNAAAEPREGP